MSGSVASSVIEDPMVFLITAAGSFLVSGDACATWRALGADDEEAEPKKDADLDEDDELGGDEADVDEDDAGGEDDDEDSDDESDDDLDDELIDLDDEYDDVDEDDRPHPGHKFLE